MASYLARCPNPCTNCLGWMPFSTSQWFLNPNFWPMPLY